MIKGWMKKIMIITMAIVLAMMLVFSAPRQSQASAASASAIVACLQLPVWMAAINCAIVVASDWVAEQIVESLLGMMQGILDTITGRFAIFMENVYMAFSMEQQLAKMEQTRYMGDIEHAKRTQEWMTTNEKTRLEDVRDARVSAGECKLITAANLQTAGEKDAKAYEAVLSEMLRKDNNFVKGGISESGVVVRNSILKAGVFQEFCSKDEHKGNLEEICLNTDEKSVGKDTATYLLTKDHTIPKEDFDAAVQMIRYLVPVPSVNPLPKSLSDDPATQAAYLQRTKEDAKYEPYERWLIEQVSRHMEPQKCPKVPGSDFDRVAFVNEIDKRLGRPVSTDRPCPSQAEFEYYTNKHMMVDPTFVSECNEGEIQTKRCVATIKGLKAKLGYDTAQLQEQRLLLSVSKRGEEKSNINTPITATGNNDNNSPVSGNTHPDYEKANVFGDGGVNYTPPRTPPSNGTNNNGGDSGCASQQSIGLPLYDPIRLPQNGNYVAAIWENLTFGKRFGFTQHSSVYFSIPKNKYTAIKITAPSIIKNKRIVTEDSRPSEGGVAAYTFAISECSGDFYTHLDQPNCKKTGRALNLHWTTNQNSPRPFDCVLEPGKNYYLNIIHSTDEGGGYIQSSCRNNTQCGVLFTEVQN